MIEVSWGVITLFIIVVLAIANGISDTNRIAELLTENQRLKNIFN
jgi:hypothetical protein